jgi:hypothetical protein
LKSRAVTATINPKHPIPLAGRGGRTVSFSAIADDLEVNLLGLQGEFGVVVLVSIDVLFASNALKAGVLAHLTNHQRSKLEDIVFIASHTHNAPQLDSTKPVLGLVDSSYFCFVAERIVKVLEHLLDPLQKDILSRVAVGKSRCDAAVVRRKRGLRLSSKWPYISNQINLRPNPAHELYRDVDVAVGSDENGKIIWLIWSWTCHATATHYSTEITADFPGAIRRKVRQLYKNPDLPVLFLPGFCGDVRSDQGFSFHQFRARLSVPFSRPFTEQTQSNYLQLCSTLAGSLFSALGQLTTVNTNDRVVVKKTAIPLTDLMTTDIPGQMELYSFDGGDLSFVFVGSEVCSPYRQKFAAVAKKGTWFSGYLNHVQCYLPDDAQILEGGYEVAGFFESFGHSGPFHPQIEDRVMSAVRELVSGTHKK